ncbi:NVEALA domain-containing protein, partial [Paraprevotella xylaniphila]|uniref:NVEALA domain-containing protein n=1 Tax=Paraprevotella xylaniphila TaxID=454155 RepID=UPI003FD72C2F
MKLKTTLVSLIGAMVIGTTGYVGYQTYEKNKAANKSDLFLENIEALADNESYKGWEVISSPCPYPIDYKNSVTCKRFGDADDCVFLNFQGYIVQNGLFAVGKGDVV